MRAPNSKSFRAIFFALRAHHLFFSRCVRLFNPRTSRAFEFCCRCVHFTLNAYLRKLPS